MNDFEPLNSLEESLLFAQRGDLPVDTFVEQLTKSRIVVPSGQEVERDWSGFQPLLFEGHEKMVGAFTHLVRAKTHAHLAPFCLEVDAIELLARMPPDHGLVLNPGYTAGLTLSPSGIAQIVQDFS